MDANQASADSEKEFIKYMASFDNVKNMTTLRKAEVNVVNVDFDVSEDGDDGDIEIVEELTVLTEKHRCEVCNEGAFLTDKLLRFGGLINEKYKFVCHKCDKNFEHKSQLKEHLSKCEGTESLQTFNSSSVSATVPQSSANSVIPQNCVIPILKKHDRIICKICYKVFKTQGGLTKHTNNLHSGATHTCEICKATFTSYLQFRQHCLGHQMLIKNHVCSTCGKRFHSSANLKKHMKRHKNSEVETILTCE